MAVTSSYTVEVRTTPLYRYYYYLCPSCGAHEPFYGISDCGAQIPSDAGYVGWFTTPYVNSNPQNFGYTQNKYYTTSLGDGGYWIFSAGNLNDTAIGTIDADSSSVVICQGYSSRKYIKQETTDTKVYAAYKIVPNEQNAVKITTQPKSGVAPKGSKATVTVKATGDGLTYTWYHKNPTASKYVKDASTTATYKATMTDASNGRYVYCIIQDQYGNKIKTNTVKVTIGNTVKITTQPKTGIAPKGSKATVTVKATGDGLTYTWYYKNTTSSKYLKAATTGATYSATMSSSVNGRYVYCMVKDQYGNQIKTNTVALRMK